MADINRVDPNQIVLANSKLKDGLAIPSNFNEIRSFVELRMRPRYQGFVELDEKGFATYQTIDAPSDQIVLTGYYERGGKSFYSTNYHNDDINSGGYEGFGIKDVSIRFDANKIPEVNVTFIDFRGRVLSDPDNNKFSKMFNLPYPLFNLRIKGGFGPTVTYKLRKIKDDISIDDSGNFIIKSKFIGDRFSPLSDLPLVYLFPVPYLINKDYSIDNTIDSFHELIIQSRKFYEKVGGTVNSAEQQRLRQEINQLEQKITRLKEIRDTLGDKNKIFDWFQSDSDYTALGSSDKLIVENFVKGLTYLNFVTTFPDTTPPPPSSPFVLPDNVGKVISKVFNEKLLQYRNQIVADGGTSNEITDTKFNKYVPLPAPGYSYDIFKSWDFTDLNNHIGRLEAEKQIKENNAAAALSVDLNAAQRLYLGGTKLTIGTIFKLMFNDYNYLMSRIKKAGDEGYNDSSKRGLDRMGYPTVIDNAALGGKKMIYPGSNPSFKTWPEVIFIEEFIQAYISSQKDTIRAEMNSATNEDGSSKYIPINPREVYAFDNNSPTSPVYNGGGRLRNIFHSKTTEQIADLLFERFIIFTNLNLEIVSIFDADDIYNDWTFSSVSGSFFGWISNIFATAFDDEDNAKKTWLTTIEAEARNLAFSLFGANQATRDYFKNLEASMSSIAFFSPTSTDPIAKTYQNAVTAAATSVLIKEPISRALGKATITKNMKIGVDLSLDDKNYVTITDIPPILITNGSPEDNFIYKFMRQFNDSTANEYKVTKDNILFIPDAAAASTHQSDFDNDKITDNHLNDSTFINKILDNGSAFNFSELRLRARYPALIQVPYALLLTMAGIIKNAYVADPTLDVYEIYFNSGLNKIRIQKSSKLLNYLLNLYSSQEATDYFINSSGQLELIPSKITEFTGPSGQPARREHLNKLYKPYYISVNSIGFTDYRDEVIYYKTHDIASDDLKKVYFRYCKELFTKCKAFITELENSLAKKIEDFEGSMKDNDVKLAIYKSFQVIYENYLFGYEQKDYKLYVDTNFKFVDRAYNPIGDICVLDMRTLLNDSRDANVSLFTAISRLLSDNNFWFYPFQGWLTNTQDYKELFEINYDQTITTIPMFIAMYVGAVSSNPNEPNAKFLDNDGILYGKLPSDFGKTKGGIDAFVVKYTGIQNQIVFSNFEHSTESLKNTDEGIKIQSEIINNASNSMSVPKGQSLLSVYQKQSYVSTIKIPLGNMGIQPTQYFYLEYLPLFEGLYIVYNVEHVINADTQKLETTFKSYRLKKDVNPFVTNEVVDFVRKIYPRASSGSGASGSGACNAPAYASYAWGRTRNKIEFGSEFSPLPINPFPSTGLKVYTTGGGSVLFTDWSKIRPHHSSSGRRTVTLDGVSGTYTYMKGRFIGRFAGHPNYAEFLRRDNAGEHIVLDTSWVDPSKPGCQWWIVAPWDGKVWNDAESTCHGGRCSCLCIVSTDGSKCAVFLHWDSQKKGKGDTFVKGEVLARIGNVSPPANALHLHIETMHYEDCNEYLKFVRDARNFNTSTNVLS
jgi:hypothetical protein